MDIFTVRSSYDRMNYLSINLVLFRVLLNIANGYEPDESIVSTDRFLRY
jgi:hypothetical protein